LTDSEKYKSEFITQLNTVKICSKQVFEEDEHKKMLKIILDIEDAISKQPDQGFADILLYMVDRAEQLLQGLQATLSGKSLASFTAGANLAEWMVMPLNDEEGFRTHRDPTQFFQVIQALTADVETVDTLKQLVILVSQEKHPQGSNSFKGLFSKLREILIQNDMHLP